MKHTPTPWVVSCGSIYTTEGIPIAEMDREVGNGTLPVERDENARHIVHCVNLHDELVEALKITRHYLWTFRHHFNEVHHEAMNKAEQALSKAKEG